MQNLLVENTSRTLNCAIKQKLFPNPTLTMCLEVNVCILAVSHHCSMSAGTCHLLSVLYITPHGGLCFSPFQSHIKDILCLSSYKLSLAMR